MELGITRKILATKVSDNENCRFWILFSTQSNISEVNLDWLLFYWNGHQELWRWFTCWHFIGQFNILNGLMASLYPFVVGETMQLASKMNASQCIDIKENFSSFNFF